MLCESFVHLKVWLQILINRWIFNSCNLFATQRDLSTIHDTQVISDYCVIAIWCSCNFAPVFWYRMWQSNGNFCKKVLRHVVLWQAFNYNWHFTTSCYNPFTDIEKHTKCAEMYPWPHGTHFSTRYVQALVSVFAELQLLCHTFLSPAIARWCFHPVCLCVCFCLSMFVTFVQTI